MAPLRTGPDGEHGDWCFEERSGEVAVELRCVEGGKRPHSDLGFTVSSGEARVQSGGRVAQAEPDYPNVVGAESVMRYRLGRGTPMSLYFVGIFPGHG